MSDEDSTEFPEPEGSTMQKGATDALRANEDGSDSDGDE